MSWSLLQSGIGIDFSEGSFQATCVKRQWNGIRVAGRLEIPQYKQLGPGDCGRLYREFLRENGLEVPWTVVALPRSAVLLRSLRLPQAVEKDLRRAVEYQLDALHPFEEESVCWDYSAWKLPETARRGGITTGVGEPGLLEVRLAIAEKKYVEEMASWFAEAGIAVSQFTVTTASLFAALQPRLEAVSGKGRKFFVLNGAAGSFELLGYAPGMALVSREIVLQGSEDPQTAVTRELEMTRSELRLQPDECPPLILCGKDLPLPAGDLCFRAVSVEQLFPSLKAGPANFRLREHMAGFAAALTAADHRLPHSFNLLPEEKRAYRSPLVRLPTYALSGLVVLLALALGIRGTMQDGLFNRYLERQIQAWGPQLQEVETTQDRSRRTSDRLELLDGARRTAALPLEILSELTRLLPSDAWLQQMRYEGDSLALTGRAASASSLLQILAGSEYFESPQFSSAISRTRDGMEVFRISVQLRTATR